MTGAAFLAKLRSSLSFENFLDHYTNTAKLNGFAHARFSCDFLRHNDYGLRFTVNDPDLLGAVLEVQISFLGKAPIAWRRYFDDQFRCACSQPSLATACFQRFSLTAAKSGAAIDC